MTYCIISKGLSIKSARILGIKKYAFRNKFFKTKQDGENYFNNLPYKYQRNQKIVKAN